MWSYKNSWCVWLSLQEAEVTEKAVMFKKPCHFITEGDHLLVLENMKKEEACGIGCFLVAMLNSDNLRGLADTPPSISSNSVYDAGKHISH